MGLLDIYRHEPDGSLSWVASADSMKIARRAIRAGAASTSEEFVIHDDQANESIILRADGRWFRENTKQKRAKPASEVSAILAGVPG